MKESWQYKQNIQFVDKILNILFTERIDAMEVVDKTLKIDARLVKPNIVKIDMILRIEQTDNPLV